MRKNALFLLLASLVVVAPGLSMAQDEDETITEGSVEIGYWDASVTDSDAIVSEFLPNEGGPVLDAEVESIGPKNAVSLDTEIRDDTYIDFALAFDLGRTFRSDTTYTSHPHRLGHQSVHHFDAITNHGRVSLGTDLDPTREYVIDYERLENWNEFQPKGFGGLTLGFGYWHQRRDGFKQSTTISHCDACHVYSQSRPIDETTSQATLEAAYAWEGGRVSASFEGRELTESTTSIDLLFDDALHPELRAPLFDNRVQWDSAEGPQPVNLQPDIDKEILRVDGLFNDVGGFFLTAEGVWSETDNLNANLKSDYSGYLLSAARPFSQKWNFRWRARTYEIDNDEVFVDTIERVGVAGPQAGLTYREIYGFDSDFLRLSALNRDVLESNVDVSYRFGKKAGRARFSWDYEDIDREFFEVGPGESSTTTNTLGVSWWARPKKGWKTNVSFEHGDADSAFANVDGKFSTLVSPAAPSPFAPQAAQYYEFQDARIAEGVATASSWDELQLRGAYTKGQRSFSGAYRYWDGKNDEGNLTDWSRSLQALTLTYWATPAPRWQWHLAWAYNDAELEAPATIALFDG